MLALVCLLPVFGFTILALIGGRIPRRLAGLLGCSTVAGSLILIAMLLPQVLTGGVTETYSLWIEGAGRLSPQFRFHLDALSGTMAGIVCFISFLIHLYSTEYMHEDPGHNRFFAYLNLFVGAMLLLLLADDMLLLFLGWEGVGLCSYLLIGFWYEDPYNVRCAQKAFYVTRIGDVAFMVGLFFLFASVGNWSLPEVLGFASAPEATSNAIMPILAVLFLIAAVAKSAQFPLHIWLPDAMAGPTPVSALLHSSTMVTAGVYLIARMHPVFLAAPEIMYLVAIVGAVTALYSGITAVGQNDIKRLLAYSTMSQIGYMILALGVGAYNAAIFHFFTHAFFKALLFLGAGAVIHAVHGEQDIRKMGGLRKKIPLTFWTFVAGSAALAALPLITSGFYSKDAILWGVFDHGYTTLWIFGVITALLTGWYSTRMVLYTFFGKPYEGKIHAPGIAVSIPLVVLAILSLVAGFLETPITLGGIHLWQEWMGTMFGPVAHHGHAKLSEEAMTQIIAAVAALSGILIAYWTAYRKRDAFEALAKRSWGAMIQGLSLTGFYIDQTYDKVFVKGFERFADGFKREWVDSFINTVLVFIRGGNQIVCASQSGRVRWYAVGLVLGSILLVAGALWL